MLTRFDDYPLHQTPEPVAHPATGDRNFYDRYFFNGYTRGRRALLRGRPRPLPEPRRDRRLLQRACAAACRSRSTPRGARRGSAARRASARIAVEVEEPMRRLRLRVGPNATGLEADAVFHRAHRGRRGAALRRARRGARGDGLDALHPVGRLERERLGRAASASPSRPAEVLGSRDRSWGAAARRRARGRRAERAARRSSSGSGPRSTSTTSAPTSTSTRTPRAAPGTGTETASPALRVAGEGAIDDERAVERMARGGAPIDWEPGTRRARRAELVLSPLARRGAAHRARAAPHLPDARHRLPAPRVGSRPLEGRGGARRRALEAAELAPLDPRHIHVQQLCRARCGPHEGIGVLEQLVLGRHAPSGFRSLLDGAGTGSTSQLAAPRGRVD